MELYESKEAPKPMELDLGGVERPEVGVKGE